MSECKHTQSEMDDEAINGPCPLCLKQLLKSAHEILRPLPENKSWEGLSQAQYIWIENWLKSYDQAMQGNPALTVNEVTKKGE